MDSQEKGYKQEVWKSELRSKMITALIGAPSEKIQAYNEVGYYYQCYAPSSLYKYYSDTELCLNSIQNNQIWYSAPCNFNDVFDCDISIDDKKVFNEALKLFPDKRGIRPGSNAWKNFRLTMNQQLRVLRATFEELRKTTGVSCFSELNDSLLMWAHYANNHRGICVEYDLIEVNRVTQFTAIPVIYSDERPCFRFFDPKSIEKDTYRLFIHSLTSKSPEWSYEKEWRIVRAQGACGENWKIDKRGALLKMIQPSSIILGCAAQTEFEQKVKDYCSCRKINLYKMEKDSIQYQLNKKVVLEFDEES